MQNGTDAPSGGGTVQGPREPLGHLSHLGYELRGAHDLDGVAFSVLTDLVALPGVARVGFAVTEGGGRRLRFVSTDEIHDPEPEWCHVDAYDDVPLTAVVRTGEPVTGSLDELESRFPGVVARQREKGMQALAAWPMPGTGSPIGGIVLFYDEPQAFDENQCRLLEAMARRTSDAVRRIRITMGRGPDEAAPDDPSLIGDGHRATVLLENDPQAAGAARRFLRDVLEEWDVEDDDAVDTAQLCLSELVNNVVMHAGTTSELTVHLEHGVLTVVVRDLGGSARSGGPTPIEVPDDDDPLRVFGRGLMLVEGLASRWGSEQDATGTTAWFVVELQHAHETSSAQSR